ncbi:DUF6916 family protein [Humibacillus xanthopallidus]|uniref:DUF6916 domain-containing protein n=1 Tax=Humibacillus xanthopallidus TaxID=412689 RepID=A0A543H8D5_9MICO|nr:hypothetical protein FBY41_4653 [Humibacillus xanthopallidus]
MVVISRRRVLQSVPVSVAAVALPSGTALAAKAPTDPLSRSRWTPYVGSTFSAKSSTSTWSVRLAAVDDLPGSPGSDRRYALRLTSAAAGRESTVSLSRAGFAATTLHLVPGSNGTTWTAVVNRL